MQKQDLHTVLYEAYGETNACGVQISMQISQQTSKQLLGQYEVDYIRIWNAFQLFLRTL